MAEQDKPTENSKDWDALASESQAQEAENPTEETQEEAAPQGILEHPSYRALEDKLTETEQALHAERDKAMRALSEADNVRKRAERDISNAHKFGIEKLCKELLAIVDSLEHALAACDAENETQKGIREGIEMTLSMFLTTLEKFSVQQIDPMGEVFDPNLHEAMSMQEDPSVTANTVIAVFQKGYQLHDRIIRPARVIVAKGS